MTVRYTVEGQENSVLNLAIGLKHYGKIIQERN